MEYIGQNISNDFQQLPCTTAALIDAYYNERMLWENFLNAREVDKGLAWSRWSTVFNKPSALTCAKLYIAY